MTKVFELLKVMDKHIKENKVLLTELDTAIGDGDHGLNMDRGFTAVIEKTPQDETNIGKVIKKAGMTLVSTVGGASGPLYGTAFMKAGDSLLDKETIDLNDLIQAIEAALDGIKMRGKAVAGEKTMIDSIEPALNALKKDNLENKSIIEALKDAIVAAKEGVEYTKTIIATKGRASYLGERSIGHRDPGAVSSLVLLEAILDFYENL